MPKSELEISESGVPGEYIVMKPGHTYIGWIRKDDEGKWIFVSSKSVFKKDEMKTISDFMEKLKL